MSHPLSTFGATRIINLASRADRRAEMIEQLQRIGVPADAHDVTFYEAVRPAEAGGFPSLGARGCFLSHLGVLDEAQAQGAPSVLILEDDLNFDADFGERIHVVTAALARSRWSIFYGGYSIAGAVPPAAGEPIAPIAAAQAVSCTHFVAFRGDALRLLPAYLRAILGRAPGDPAGGPMHVDGAYSRFRHDHPELETVIALPELGHQRASRTDIHALRWYDHWPVVRDGVAWIRKLKNAA